MRADANRDKSRRWRELNPDRNKMLYQGQHCKRLYGITLAQKMELLAKQGDRCAICQTEVPGGKGWHVDHDHETKVVRGVLCHSCNLGIGHLKDDVNLLQRAIDYLTARPDIS